MSLHLFFHKKLLMPKESQPVILRTSASANGWWAKMADAEVNKSFRVLDGQTSLFTDYVNLD